MKAAATSSSNLIFWGTPLPEIRVSKPLVNFHQNFTAPLPKECCPALKSIMIRVALSTVAVFAYLALGTLVLIAKLKKKKVQQPQPNPALHAQCLTKIKQHFAGFQQKPTDSKQFCCFAFKTNHTPLLTTSFTSIDRDEYTDKYDDLMKQIDKLLRNNTLSDCDYSLDHLKIIQNGTYSNKYTLRIIQTAFDKGCDGYWETNFELEKNKTQDLESSLTGKIPKTWHIAIPKDWEERLQSRIKQAPPVTPTPALPPPPKPAPLQVTQPIIPLSLPSAAAAVQPPLPSKRFDFKWQNRIYEDCVEDLDKYAYVDAEKQLVFIYLRIDTKNPTTGEEHTSISVGTGFQLPISDTKSKFLDDLAKLLNNIQKKYDLKTDKSPITYNSLMQKLTFYRYKDELQYQHTCAGGTSGGSVKNHEPEEFSVMGLKKPDEKDSNFPFVFPEPAAIQALIPDLKNL